MYEVIRKHSSDGKESVIGNSESWDDAFCLVDTEFNALRLLFAGTDRDVSMKSTYQHGRRGEWGFSIGGEHGFSITWRIETF